MTRELDVREVFGGAESGAYTDADPVEVPASAGSRLAKALVIGAAASVAYLLALMLTSVLEGRSAIFNGNRYLPDAAALIPRHFGAFELVKSCLWVAGIGAIVAIPPALLAPARVLRSGRLRTWLVIGAGWSLAVFVVAFVVLGFPADPSMQRSGSSYEGVRTLGIAAFAFAHVVYGFAIAAPLRRAARTKVLCVAAARRPVTVPR